MRYRLREPVIEAFQVTPENGSEVAAWCRGTLQPDPVFGGSWGSYIVVPGAEGATASEGDYILRYLSSGFYRVMPSHEFELLYEPA